MSYSDIMDMPSSRRIRLLIWKQDLEERRQREAEKNNGKRRK